MESPRVNDTIDLITWLVVAVLTVGLIVIAIQYVISLFGLSLGWVQHALEVIAATAVGLLFGHRRGARKGKQ